MKDTFVTLARFQYSSEAHIFRGKLESEGVNVFMADDFTVDVDPLISNAIGGVKLKVFSKDLEKAEKVLKSISKYSLNDDGQPVVCTNCSSQKVNFITTVKSRKSFFCFIVGLLSTSLPFYTKYKYKCEECKTEFEK